MLIHTAESFPAVSQHSSGIKCSSMRGVATCWRDDIYLIIRSICVDDVVILDVDRWQVTSGLFFLGHMT